MTSSCRTPHSFRLRHAWPLTPILLAVLALAASPLIQLASASEAGKEFNQSDAALNVAYKAVLATIKNPQERASFVEAQRAWITFRDRNVALFAARYPASKGGLFYNTHLTKERTAFLNALLATPAEVDDQGPGAFLE